MANEKKLRRSGGRGKSSLASLEHHDRAYVNVVCHASLCFVKVRTEGATTASERGKSSFCLPLCSFRA